jgi:hypothetical protein
MLVVIVFMVHGAFLSRLYTTRRLGMIGTGEEKNRAPRTVIEGLCEYIDFVERMAAHDE